MPDTLSAVGGEELCPQDTATWENKILTAALTAVPYTSEMKHLSVIVLD